MRQKGISSVIFVVVAIIILAGTGLYLYLNKTARVPVGNVQDEDISNWKTYRNDEHGFEVGYPTLWSVETIEDRSGSYILDITDQHQVLYSLFVLTKENPRLSHYISNPECYQRFFEETYNNIIWTLSWWTCGYDSNSDHTAASVFDSNRNVIYEIHLNPDFSPPYENRSIPELLQKILSTFTFIE